MAIKIVHFVSGLISGGVEQVLYNYISKMDPSEYENYIIYQHEADRVCYDKLNSVCKGLYNIPFKKEHPFKNLREARRLIKEIKPDIVHCHMTKVNFFGLWPAKKERVPVRINHSHTAIVNFGFAKKLFYKLCDKINSKCATHHMGCGEEAAKFIYKPKKDNRRIDILTNRIDDKKFAYSIVHRDGVRKILGISDSEKLIGTVGRLEVVKNHTRLIEVFKCVNDRDANTKLLIIGTGSLKEQLLNLSKQYSIEDNVIIMEPVTDVYRYYSALDCFVLPSLYEGLPLTSVEAQFNEVPTILSSTVAPSAKMTDDVSYLSLEESNDVWANKIIEKLSIGRHEKDTALLYEKYSLNNPKNDLAEYYKEMLGV